MTDEGPMEAFGRYLADLAEKAKEGNDNVPPLNPDIHARKVLDTFEDYSRPHNFKPGDLVVCKANAPFNQPKVLPGVVWEVLDPPVFDDDHDCSLPFFRMPLDIKVGIYVNDSFGIFHMWSKCLEPYTGKVFPKGGGDDV